MRWWATNSWFQQGKERLREYPIECFADERDTLLDMYTRAMETAGPESTAKEA
jgi:hypothetical protein